MKDRNFFIKSFEIFFSKFKKISVDPADYDDSFWLKATEKIQEALSISEKTLPFTKAIYIFDQITPDSLLDLLFISICYKQRAFNLVTTDPDKLGNQFIWPYHPTEISVWNELISTESKLNMMKELNIEELTRQFNCILNSDLLMDFPKTYKRLNRYYKEN